MRRNSTTFHVRDTFSVSTPSGSQNPPTGGRTASDTVGPIPLPVTFWVTSTGETASDPELVGAWASAAFFFFPVLEADSIRVRGLLQNTLDSTLDTAFRLKIINQFVDTFVLSPSVDISLGVDECVSFQFDWKIDQHISVGTLTDTIVAVEYIVTEFVALPVVNFLYIDSALVLGATEACVITVATADPTDFGAPLA